VRVLVTTQQELVLVLVQIERENSKISSNYPANF
jgi:hypothetical protein